MIINLSNLLTQLFYLYIKLSIYYTLIKARHVKINQKFYLVFNAILLLISQSYVLTIYFDIEQNSKSGIENPPKSFGKQVNFAEMPIAWVAGLSGNRADTSACIFEHQREDSGNESSRLYIVDISLLHEIFNGSCARWQWIFDAGRNAV